MNTTTIITGLGTLTASTSATVDKDGNIDKKRRNKIAATTITTTATTIAQNMITAKHLSRIYEMSAQAYVDSMTDEELAEALEKLDLLEKEDNSSIEVKTL